MYVLVSTLVESVMKKRIYTNNYMKKSANWEPPLFFGAGKKKINLVFFYKIGCHVELCKGDHTR